MNDNVIPFPGMEERYEEDVLGLMDAAGNKVWFRWVTGFNFRGESYAVLHPLEDEEDVVAFFKLEADEDDIAFRDDFDPELQEAVFAHYLRLREGSRDD